MNVLILLLIGAVVVGVVILAGLAVNHLEGGSEPTQEGSDDVLQDLLKYAKSDEERRQILQMAQDQGMSGAAELALTFAMPQPRYEYAPPEEDLDNTEEKAEEVLFEPDAAYIGEEKGALTEEEMEQTLILPPAALANDEGE